MNSRTLKEEKEEKEEKETKCESKPL